MPRIELTTWIAAPVERCFDLSRSVELHLRSTAETGEQVIAGVTSGLLGPGDEVTWRARHLGIWQTLSSRMTTFDRPRHFRDSMVAGAFQRFDHDHFFEPERDGTTMRDVFDYTSPLGALGRVADALFLERYMRRLLEIRNRELKAIAESDEWERLLPTIRGPGPW
jgi:ligand-binding SRPBCC domain-containing protein